MKTKTRPWRHIYHDIEIPRPKNHDIEKRRQLTHDIVIPIQFFRRQKATISRFQGWKTTTSKFQDQKATTLSSSGILTPDNELSLGYSKDPTQKWYVWASFQTSGKRFHTLQEVIWLTAINGIFKFPPRLGSFCQINYLFELFSGYPSFPIQKWYIWASFQTSRKKFYKLQKAIWATVVNENFKFPPRLGSFCQIAYLFEVISRYSSYPIQEWYIWASLPTTRKKFRNLFNFWP